MKLKNIYAVTALDLRNTARDKTAVFFLLVFPVAFYVFFATFYGATASEEASIKYYNSTTPHFSAVLILMVAFLNIAPTVALSREMGFLNRLMVTPLKVSELWVGLCLRAMLLFAIGYMVMLVAGYFLFGYLPHSDPLQIGFTILLAAFALLPAGILIGVAFKRFQSAFNAGMLVMQPMIVLSGAGLPREAFPHWAQRISDFIPSTYAVQVTELGWQGAYFSRAAIWPSTILVVFGAACAFAAAVIFRNSYR